MELSKIINARKLFTSFMDEEDIGTHLAYLMVKFIITTQAEQCFYDDALRKIVKKHSTLEGDEQCFISQDKLPYFYEDLDLLNRTDVEDPGIRFNLSELVDKLKLPMRQIYLLFDFIQDDANNSGDIYEIKK